MNWLTVVSTVLVPFASVVSTATVAIWTKRIDARTRKEDREHALILDYEERAGDDKKAVLKSLISATLHLKRGAEQLAGIEQTVSHRRAVALSELYEFRARMGLDDGIAELMIYASEEVRDLTELVLDEWDRQFREQGYSLKQLDACKKHLLQVAVDVPPGDDQAIIDGQQKWFQLKREESSWLDRLGDESTLDVEALVELCNRLLTSAHKDLRGGHGIGK